MKDILIKLKDILEKEKYTCIVMNNDEIYSSQERGVRPLVNWLKSSCDFKGALVADKVVGKAAAFLYVLLGIKGIYSIVISEPAYLVFKKYNIIVMYDEKVPAIKNRTNTGFCPLETATLNVDDPDGAYTTIIKTLEELSKIS